ncbi:DUF4340 domain-containing protein [Membranihabitans maritimus]|uniref:DUF4340 domain-containing protein n=1 Tax=Membranihabitans maritimus TaxID=2904244 RepID=UPI001F15CA78|nr:DUF4340 domain-containing protein [Membranihabitans maritimus]
MIKNPTNKKLAVTLMTLTIFYAGLKLFGNQRDRSSTFRENIVAIDTSAITSILLSGSSDPIKFHRNNGSWEITLLSGKKVSAVNSKVVNMLNSLQRISPSSIATKDPQKWRDYQVDSTGKRIEVFEGENKSLDLIIGRSGTIGQRGFLTYVRLFNEENVYAIDDFMGSSVPTTPASYRDQNILNITPDSIEQVSFTYSTNENFTLENQDSLWQMDGSIAVDSIKTAEFFNGLKRITSKNFADDIETTSLGTPSANVIFQSGNKREITITKYDKVGIVHSSTNPENYFSDTAAINKIFVAKNYLIQPQEN